MAIVDCTNVAFLLVDGYDLLGVATDVKDEGLERESVEKLYLGQSMRHKKLTGVSRAGVIEQSGSFDDAAGSSHAVLMAGGQDRVLSWALAGNTIGEHFVGAVVDHVAYIPQLVAGDFTEANARYNITEHESGLILAELTERTGDWNTQASAVDNGASSSGGGVAYLQCTDIDLGGYTNLVVKVRHSADGAVWADLATFTALTACGGERITIATEPINRHLAVSGTWTGAGADQAATLVVGFYRNE
jgi:hypothetical protein